MFGCSLLFVVKKKTFCCRLLDVCCLLSVAGVVRCSLMCVVVRCVLLVVSIVFVFFGAVRALVAMCVCCLCFLLMLVV